MEMKGQGRNYLASNEVNVHESRRRSSRIHSPSKRTQIPITPDGIASSTRRSIKTPSSLSKKRLIQRRRLDARVTGTLQDVLAAQEFWEVVELNASSKLSLRLLEVLSHCTHVQSLILIDPCEAVQLFLAGWLGNTQSILATVDHVMIQTGTIVDNTAISLCDAWSSTSCRVTHLQLCDVSMASWNVVESIAQGLKSFPRLVKLSLRSCHLEDNEVALILQGLQQNVNLKNLCLSKNYCQEEGTMAIADILTSPTTTLQILDVSSQETWDDRGYYIYLARALSKRQCPLQELNLASNFVHDGQFMDLIEALCENNTCLQSLNVRDNRITDIGMHHLVQSLPHLSLTRLDVSYNAYGRQVVVDLENVLKTQTVLLQLSIDHGENCPMLSFYLALNRSGRYCKAYPKLPLGLWPLILERCQQKSLDVQLPKISDQFNFTATDLVFDLLHGPVLLER